MFVQFANQSSLATRSAAVGLLSCKFDPAKVRPRLEVTKPQKEEVLARW